MLPQNRKYWIPRIAQKKTIKLGLQKSCCIFLQPGLGKTSIALELYRLHLKRRNVKRMLVIAPILPCYLTWPAEIKKWSNFKNLTWTILHGFGKARRLHRSEEHTSELQSH